MSGFDERCPHCGTKLEDLNSSWCDRDYQSPFIIDCDKCGKPVEVTVHTVPEFETAITRCAFCHSAEVSGNTYCGPCLKHLATQKAIAK